MEDETRCVRDVVEPHPTLEGAGVRLRRTIGTHTLDYLDPFLLLDHFASDGPRDHLAGFPWHPHRGIETVTYAPAGILHEEMPRPRDGRMAGFQLWVNLPASLKMTQPRYQEVRADRMTSA